MANAYTSRRSVGRRPTAPARKPGNWKLAYADFLTALCAFFLVMWIVNGVSSEDKAELARQFSAETESAAISADEAPPALAASSTAMQLAARLRDDPGLRAYGSSVTVTAEPKLVRIDVTDMATRPLFETGDGALNQTGLALLQAVALPLSLLPYPLAIEGHTDANPSLMPGYSNWELSADRANSARRILAAHGVSAARIRAVLGLADTRPINPHAPLLPANRRISIVIHLDSD